jgi:hypothetical protein
VPIVYNSTNGGEKKAMSIHYRLGVLCAALALSIGPAYAGPCLVEIDRMQVRVDALIAATAVAGPSAPQSSAATSHRQPTPGSIAAAEEKLGEGGRGERALAAMAQARAADRAGDTAACERALAEVQRALAPQ